MPTGWLLRATHGPIARLAACQSSALTSPVSGHRPSRQAAREAGMGGHQAPSGPAVTPASPHGRRPLLRARPASVGPQVGQHPLRKVLLGGAEESLDEQLRRESDGGTIVSSQPVTEGVSVWTVAVLDQREQVSSSIVPWACAESSQVARVRWTCTAGRTVRWSTLHQDGVGSPPRGRHDSRFRWCGVPQVQEQRQPFHAEASSKQDAALSRKVQLAQSKLPAVPGGLTTRLVSQRGMSRSGRGGKCPGWWRQARHAPTAPQ
jgi:hypothetical protein